MPFPINMFWRSVGSAESRSGLVVAVISTWEGLRNGRENEAADRVRLAFHNACESAAGARVESVFAGPDVYLALVVSMAAATELADNLADLLGPEAESEVDLNTIEVSSGRAAVAEVQAVLEARRSGVSNPRRPARTLMGWFTASGQMPIAPIDDVFDELGLRDRPLLRLGKNQVAVLGAYLNGLLAAQDPETAEVNQLILRDFGSWLGQQRSDQRSVGWPALVEDQAIESKADEIATFFELWDQFRSQNDDSDSNPPQ